MTRISSITQNNAADQLIGVTAPGATASYGYDADGIRVTQTFNRQVTNALWDEASVYGDVVLETDASGTPLARYILAGTQLLSQTRSGTTSYYLQDGQGSIRALNDSAGALTGDSYSCIPLSANCSTKRGRPQIVISTQGNDSIR